MTFERWQLVKTVLYPALKLAPEQRVIFVSEACAEDKFLESQVASLIGYHETGTVVRLRTPRHLLIQMKPRIFQEVEHATPLLTWFDRYDQGSSFRNRLPVVIGTILAAALIAVLLILRR